MYTCIFVLDMPKYIFNGKTYNYIETIRDV